MLSQLINWLKLGLTSWYAVCLLKQLKDVWHWTWWVHKVLSLKTELFKPGAWDWTHSSDRCKVGWECKLDGHDRRLVYIWLIMSVDSCKIQVDVVRMSPHCCQQAQQTGSCSVTHVDSPSWPRWVINQFRKYLLWLLMRLSQLIMLTFLTMAMMQLLVPVLHITVIMETN